MSAVDGGPAFPTLAVVADMALSEGGLTLRDYFAAHAPITMDDARAIVKHIHATDSVFEVAALCRYAYADAMIAARKVEGEK